MPSTEEERFGGKKFSLKNCISPSNNFSCFPTLKDYLPDYAYHVCDYETLTETDDHVNFKATLRMAMSSEDEIKQWLKLHPVTWRVDRTRKGTGQKVIFKVEYRCQHYQPKRGKENVPRNSVPNKSSSGILHKLETKNTNCPAKMTVKLVRTEVSRGRKSLSADPHVPAFPTMVNICSNHNHNINVAAALYYRDVGVDAREKLIRLFETGHSPSSALDLLKLDLLEEHGDNYVLAAANKELCPSQEFCYRLYQQIFRQAYGNSGVDITVALEKKVEEYNTENGDQCAAVMTTSGGKQLVAICSPLMKRVHMHIKHSAEMCFMDASGNLDRDHWRVFLLLTHSVAGGLPLGIIIAPTEEEQVIFEGLELLKSLLDDRSFSGRGMKGPAVFMTDDSKAEQGALRRAFPDAKRVLCIFHLLQAAWRWLWSNDNRITAVDRSPLLAVIRDMLYAKEEAALNSFYHQATQSSVVSRYPKFKVYMDNLYSRRVCWALCYRNALPVRGNNTNNFCEAAMRILKDKILHRTKAYNILQLFDFMGNRLSEYYKAKVTHAAIGRWEAFQKSRFLVRDNDVKPEDIHQIAGSHFQVKSTSTPGKRYDVDADLATCTCPMGSTGGPCKHQAAVVLHHRVSSSNFLPQTADEKAELHYIATGIHYPVQFFKPLREETVLQAELQPEVVTDLDVANDAGREETHSQEMVGRQETHAQEMVAEEAASEEASHQAATEGLAEMYEDLLAKVSSDSSMAVAVVAAVKAYNKIKNNPSKVSTALHMFCRYNNTRLASVRSTAIRKAARHAGPAIHVQPPALRRRKIRLGGRRRLNAGRPAKVTAGPDHVYSQPSKSVRTLAPHCLAHSVVEGRRHPK